MKPEKDVDQSGHVVFGHRVVARNHGGDVRPHFLGGLPGVGKPSLHAISSGKVLKVVSEVDDVVHAAGGAAVVQVDKVGLSRDGIAPRGCSVVSDAEIGVGG